VLIYHTSDLHDHRGFAGRLNELRAAEPGLLFDCGDSLRGSQTIYHANEPVIAEIDAAGYDAQGMGNREFHYLFGGVRARAKKMHHPLVCSNLVDTKGRELPFHRYYTLQSDGTRVHLLGLLIMQYPAGSAWERIFGWRFLDPIETIAQFAVRVPQAEPLIVLSHLGLSLDRKLAAAMPRITLLLGGHSHDTLHSPEIVNGVPIVHAGPYGRFVSRTRLLREDGAWRMEQSALIPLLPQ
jgi:2',3'-cyclic-nucleotide 2'-phosphodiesterase (5'-nucleotidase family)